MRLAIIGLGRMGMNMARRLLQKGHEVVAYNRTSAKTDELAQEGAIPAYSLQEVVEKLTQPRVMWVMLPAGKTVDEHLSELAGLAQAGDILIEGGNSNFHDDQRRAAELASRGLAYLDAGVSGGIWGLTVGYCLMIGGSREAFEHCKPIFESLAPPEGCLHCGPVGAGHFVKMIHNGIEYGMMQAYAEGFQILEDSEFSDHFDYQKISHLWNQGSVVRSWLLELAEDAFAKSGRLMDIQGYVEDSGEGRWTVQEAIASSTPAPVLTLSLFERFRSRRENTFADRVLAALRREFGGHAVKKNG